MKSFILAALAALAFAAPAAVACNPVVAVRQFAAVADCDACHGAAFAAVQSYAVPPWFSTSSRPPSWSASGSLPPWWSASGRSLRPPVVVRQRAVFVAPAFRSAVIVPRAGFSLRFGF